MSKMLVYARSTAGVEHVGEYTSVTRKGDGLEVCVNGVVSTLTADEIGGGYHVVDWDAIGEIGSLPPGEDDDFLN